jgi:hypothetical protein
MTDPGSPPAPPPGPAAPPPGWPVPAPPPGPGVQPPFVAPPTDGTGRRRGQAIISIVALVLVCCAGSVGGLVGLVVLSQRAFADEARSAVTNYMKAVQQEDYAKAYAQLCEPLQNQISEPELAQSYSEQPSINSFTVADPVANASRDAYEVRVTLHSAEGADRDQQFLVIQDQTTARFEVCGFEG